MTICFIGAMDSEIEGFNNKFKDKKTVNLCGLEFYEINVNNNKIVTTISGMGKVNAAITTTLLINNYHPDLVINTGIAGGGKNVQTKDLMVVTRSSYNDVNAMAFGYEFGQVPKMPLFFEANPKYLKLLQESLERLNIKYVLGETVSGDSFLSTKAGLKYIPEGAFAVEMEGAAIAHTCYKLNTPAIFMRFISDILDEEAHVKNYFEFEAEASNKSSLIAYEFIMDFLKNN